MGLAMKRAGLVRNGLCLAFALAIGGCAASTARYPSLERWPAERMAFVPGSASTESATPADNTVSPDLSAKLASLVGQARGSRSDFAARQPATERALAAGGAPGSDSWARASTALAELETARDPAVQALAQLDELEVDNRTKQAGAENADTAAIVAARDEVAAITDAQAQVVTRLRARLS
jgi:hypothetical protein